jgi:hypothetical protein
MSPVRHLTALLCLIALTLTASSAAAEGICTSFAKAKQADIKDAHVQRAIKVWERISAPFQAMTGRTTGLVVLAREAGQDKNGQIQPYPPTGHICPGAPPVVYVTWPLIELLYDKKTYPESFLAFVLGHELGHRFNDLDASGSLLGAEQRPGKGRHEESLADKRAAFFATLAGYPMTPLARQDIVATFLSSEIGLRRGAVDERKAALMAALSSFDAYESLYQTALLLNYSAEGDAAERLLERADELIAADGVPLPELKALRAIHLIQRAAPFAPWHKGLTARIDVDALRCDPVFPAHTALKEEPTDGALRAAGDEEAQRARAIERLKLAKKLLDQAEEYGVAPIILHSARTCAAFYEGDSKTAAAEAEYTRELLTSDTPQAVRDAIAANDAVRALGEALVASPPPGQSDPAAKSWGKKMSKLVGDKRYKASAGAQRTLKMLATYPKPPAPSLTSSAQPACKGKQDPAQPAAMSMPPTPDKLALGVCPAGWVLLHTIPGQDKAREAGTSLGVTTCAPAEQTANGPRHRLVFIELPGAMSPELEAMRLKIFVQDIPTPQRRPLADWSCGCGLMQQQGVSDTGETIYLSSCLTRGLPLGVLIRDVTGHIARIAQIETL